MNAREHFSWEVELWQAVSHCEDLSETISQVLQLLQRHIPVRGVVIRRIDIEQGRLITVASATLDDVELPHALTERRQMDTLSARHIAAWLSELRPEHSSRLPSDLAEGIGASDIDFLAAPVAVTSTHAWFATFTTTERGLLPGVLEQLRRARAGPGVPAGLGGPR